jgi:FkbM family methyltransferase
MAGGKHRLIVRLPFLASQKRLDLAANGWSPSSIWEHVVRMSYKSSLLQFLNRLLKPFGVGLRRRGHPTRTFGEFIEHLGRQGLRFRTVIDVGVAAGTPALYAGVPHAKFHLVEPVPGALDQLRPRVRHLNAEFHPVAAGAEDSTVTFFVHDDVSGSSLYRQAEGPVLDGREVTVPMRRLDTLLPAVLDRPVLMKIDTQGHEMGVIEGAAGLLRQIDVVILETSMVAFREGIPEFADVVIAMQTLGFRVYDLLEGHERALDGALAQVDVAFVPQASPLRADPRFFNDQQLSAYVKGGVGR